MYMYNFMYIMHVFMYYFFWNTYVQDYFIFISHLKLIPISHRRSKKEKLKCVVVIHIERKFCIGMNVIFHRCILTHAIRVYAIYILKWLPISRFGVSGWTACFMLYLDVFLHFVCRYEFHSFWHYCHEQTQINMLVPPISHTFISIDGCKRFFFAFIFGFGIWNE